MKFRRPAGPYSFDSPTDGLRQRATGGIVKTGLSQGVRLLVQFASVVLLSRLLLPAEFGLVAMAAPVVAFAALFQDLGLSQAVVQKPNLTQSEVSGLFWMNIGISAVLALLLVAASPLVADFYGEKRVGPLIAAMGANVLCGGLGALHYALLNRRMRFGVLAIIDAAGAIGSLVVSAVFALATHSFWSLFAGSLASLLIPTMGYWLASGWLPSRPSLQAEVRTALHFGANVTGFNLANFFARNLDNVLIGHASGERALGLYDRAYKLLLMPLQQINAPISKVMLPLLAQLGSDRERYERAFLGALSQMLLLALPGTAFMIATSDTLIPVVLGQRWAGAAPIFAALGMAGLLQVLNNTSGWLFVSQHRTREYLHWGLFSGLTCVGSFLIGMPFGPFGVAAAYAAGEYLRTPLLWSMVLRRGPVARARFIRVTLPHYAGVVGSLAAILAIRQVADMPPLALLAVSLLLSYITSISVVAAFTSGRMTLSQSFHTVLRPLQRVQTS